MWTRGLVLKTWAGVLALWLTCCDLERNLPLSEPQPAERKCEKVLPVVSNSWESLAGRGASDSSFPPKSPSHPAALATPHL